MPDLLPSLFPFHGRNKCQPGNLMSARKAREKTHSSRISSQRSPKTPQATETCCRSSYAFSLRWENLGLAYKISYRSQDTCGTHAICLNPYTPKNTHGKIKKIALHFWTEFSILCIPIRLQTVLGTQFGLQTLDKQNAKYSNWKGGGHYLSRNRLEYSKLPQIQNGEYSKGRNQLMVKFQL